MVDHLYARKVGVDTRRALCEHVPDDLALGDLLRPPETQLVSLTAPLLPLPLSTRRTSHQRVR